MITVQTWNASEKIITLAKHLLVLLTHVYSTIILVLFVFDVVNKQQYCMEIKSRIKY